MAITAAGIAKVLELLAGVLDKIEVLDASDVVIDDKVPVITEETGYIESTVYFAHDEANDAIAKIRTYAGAVQVAENTVDIIKTDRQSLTIVRRDYLEGV